MCRRTTLISSINTKQKFLYDNDIVQMLQTISTNYDVLYPIKDRMMDLRQEEKMPSLAQEELPKWGFSSAACLSYIVQKLLEQFHVFRLESNGHG